jgi:hypothetical protein
MRIFPALIVVVSALATASSADAQWRSERPYRGLFAGGIGETEQLLTATGSLGTGWDSNLAADAIGRNVPVSDVNREFRGSVSTASAALSYSLNRTAVAFGATAGTTTRFYPSISNQFVRRDYGSIGAAAILGAGFSAQAGALYQPYNLRSMMPTFFEPRLGDPAIVDEDFPASLEHYFGYSAGAGYTRNLTRRQMFSASYDYRARQRGGFAHTFGRHAAKADLTHLLSRDLSLRFGYVYTAGRYGDDRRFGTHSIDVGVDYNRALSVSRRTTLSFGTGSNAMRRSRNDALQFRLNGNVRLNHEIGRTWLANLTYFRGLQFIETWPEPVYSDSAVAGVGGLVNSRVQVQLAARWLRGRSYFEADRDRLESYGGNAVVTVAITRFINSGVAYAYYHHQFQNLIAPVPGFPGELDRQSARAFVSMWVPLFQRVRRP